jgi:hypothetical protein
MNVALLIVSTATAIEAQSGPSVTSAYQELGRRVVANSNSFYVYLDEDSGLNHGFPSGVFTGNGASQVTIDPGCIDDPLDTTIGCYPASDTTALDQTHGTVFRITFPPETGDQFTGLNIEEPQNWGAINHADHCGVTTTCNPYDLTGATNVEFDVRSPGGITLQFGVGSVPNGGCATPFVTVPASTTYTHVSLSLGPPSLPSCTPNLGSVNVLFFVVTNAHYAQYGGTVLLDNIQFTPAPARVNQQGETRSLPLSTQTSGVVPQTSNFPPDQVNRNVGAVYESALTTLALLARGQPQDLTNAQEIANALDYAVYHDNHGDFIPTSPGASSGCFGGTTASQCGLHNAYESGDIALLNNQAAPAQGLAGDIRLAGFTCGSGSPTGFCLDLDGATGGNNAWVMLALLAAYQKLNDTTYLNDAITIGNWIVSLMDTSGTGYGGYFAGYPDMGLPKVLETGKSIENNADIFAAFNLLSEIEAGLGNSTAAAQWNANATAAANFVLAMYDPVKGRFYLGTTPVGSSPSPGCSAGPQKGNDVIDICDFLDANSFSALALSGSQQFGLYSPYSGDWRPVISYVQNLAGANTFTQTITANGLKFSGFDLVPASPGTGIAWEFTGQMVEGCNYLDAVFGASTFSSCAQTYLAQIAQAQASAPFADGSGLVAATLNGENNPPNNLPPVNECLSTPFQCIPERVGLAATNWAIFADSAINPLVFYPQGVLSLTSVSFGNQLIGGTSTPQTVTLISTGSAVLSVQGIAISGTNKDDFAFAPTNTCESSLTTGATCGISVTFTPLGGGPRSASVTITDNAPDGSQTISLSGTGTGVPESALSSISVSFGNQVIKTTSAARIVTLKSTGTAYLIISGFTLTGANPGDFGKTNNCPARLAPGAKCTISVTFSPSILGAESATLMVNDNAANGPETVTLSGAGIAPATLTPASHNFGNVAINTASNPVNFILHNSELTPLSLSIGFTGANYGDFSQTNTCGSPPTSLAAGTSCTITVIFTPSTLTTETATLTVNDNAAVPYNILTSSLTGTGVADVTLSPGSHNFGNVAMGTAIGPVSFTLKNNLLVALSDLSITFVAANAGDFSLTNNTCGSSLASYGSCTFGVGLIVSALGAQTATLMVNENAPAPYNTLTSSLSWTGVPDATLTPGSHNFGTVVKGTPSKPQTFTLHNSELTTLSVSIGFAGSNPPDFSLTNNTCGSSLASYASCTFGVIFTPSTTGAESATLKVEDSAAAAQYQTLTSTLTGTGAP